MILPRFRPQVRCPLSRRQQVLYEEFMQRPHGFLVMCFHEEKKEIPGVAWQNMCLFMFFSWSFIFLIVGQTYSRPFRGIMQFLFSYLLVFSDKSEQNIANWEIYHWVGLRLQLLMFDWCGEKLMSWLEAWRWLVDLVSLPAQETAVLSAHDRHGQVHDRSAGLDALFGNTCSTMTSRWSTWEDRFAMCFTKCILLF